MSKFIKYRRTQIAEMRPVTKEEIELGRLIVTKTHTRKAISVRRSSSDWVFCNTKLEPYPNPWSSDYRCPKCGNNLVNIVGTCATKVYK